MIIHICCTALNWKLKFWAGWELKCVVRLVSCNLFDALCLIGPSGSRSLGSLEVDSAFIFIKTLTRLQCLTQSIRLCRGGFQYPYHASVSTSYLLWSNLVYFQSPLGCLCKIRKNAASRACLSFILRLLLHRWWLSAPWPVPGSSSKKISIFRAAGLWAHPRPHAVQNASRSRAAAPPTQGTPPPLNRASSAKKPSSDHSTNTDFVEKAMRASQAARVALCSRCLVESLITPPADRWFIFPSVRAAQANLRWSEFLGALWAHAKPSAETVATSNWACQCLKGLLSHQKKLNKNKKNNKQKKQKNVSPSGDLLYGASSLKNDTQLVRLELWQEGKGHYVIRTLLASDKAKRNRECLY